MATKLLRLTADEKKEAKRDGQSLSGESVVSYCLHGALNIKEKLPT